jgi:hypothetical protein
MISVLTLAWSGQGDLELAHYGAAVASGGDVNADGFDDLIVGAPGGPGRAGFVSVLLGSETTAVTEWSLDGPPYGSAAFGRAVSSAGDMNGDGYDDVVVGLPQASDFWAYPPRDDVGAAYVYFGASDRVEIGFTVSTLSNQIGASFGYSVAGAGDVDDDGFADLLVGAPHYDNNLNDEGGIWLFLGSSARLGVDTDSDGIALGKQAGALFGASVAAAGDVNGDGHADVMVGSPRFQSDPSRAEEGAAFVFLGSQWGLEFHDGAAWDVGGGQASAAFGSSIASAGDVNSDGFDDVVIGAPYYDDGETDEGVARLFLGSSVGLATIPGATIASNQASAWLGYSVGGAGDVNGDGFDDVVIGAPGTDNGEIDEGTIGLYPGGTEGLSTAPIWTDGANEEFAQLGYAVASGGDVNGDGYLDILGGAPFADLGEPAEGMARLYVGACHDATEDSDGDVVGDRCDQCPGSDDLADVDGDGVSDGCDVCPDISDPGQEDDDQDNLGDACDPCRFGTVDNDGDSVCDDKDCDDANPVVYPDAPELCDGVDTNCSGWIAYEEFDNDGDGFAPCDGDCDDDDPNTFPGAPELCDGIDNACAGVLSDDESDDDADGLLPCEGDHACDERDGSCATNAGCSCVTNGTRGGPFILVAALVSIVARRALSAALRRRFASISPSTTQPASPTTS